MLDDLKRLGPVFALDMETALAPVCFEPRQARLLQLHSDTCTLTYDLLSWGQDEWDTIAAWLARPSLEVFGQNLAFDYRVLLANGVRIGGTLRDSMVASQLLHNGKAKMSHSLAEIVRRELGRRMDKTLQARNWMEVELGPEDLQYAEEDVRVTWEVLHVLHEKVAANGLQQVYELECALIPAVVQMEHTGMWVDGDVISETIEFYRGEYAAARMCFLETLDGRLQDEGLDGLPKDDDGTFNTRVKDSGSVRLGTKLLAGYNLNSAQQTLAYFKKLGIEPHDDAGKPSLDKKVLARFQSDELVRLYLAKNRVFKRQGMAEKLCEHRSADGRIRARFMPLATGTGRFSCVAGDTVLITSRGDFTFAEYVPMAGDLVMTHKGRWMPVVRKLYRGVEDTVELLTAECGKLTCTRDHKLLSQGNWVPVGSLRPGDTLEYFPQLDQRRDQHPCRSGALQGAGQAASEGLGLDVGYHLSQRSARSAASLDSRGVQSRESLAVLTVEDRIAEPDERKEWFPSSQLQGFSSRSQGVSDGTRRLWWPGVPAPTGHGPSNRSGDIALSLGGASHRRQPTQQQLGQLGSCDVQGTQRLASSETRVVSIKPVGSMGVWDIEVLGDHSYALYGFLSHNCSAPNLQQVPRDVEFRSAFRAPAGRKLVQADYAAMELRVAAAIAQETAMLAAFAEGADIHTRTASLMFGVSEADVSKGQRQQAKATNFGALYGSGARGLQAYFATVGMFISEREAGEFRRRWHKAYPAISEWHNVCQSRAVQGSPMRTMIGRRRYLYGQDNRLTTQANNLVQGTSADIMKAALVEIHRQLPATAYLVAVVHDEIIVECDEADAQDVLALVTREMEEAAVPIIGDSVRVLAEGGVLDSWGDK